MKSFAIFKGFSKLEKIVEKLEMELEGHSKGDFQCNYVLSQSIVKVINPSLKKEMKSLSEIFESALMMSTSKMISRTSDV